MVTRINTIYIGPRLSRRLRTPLVVVRKVLFQMHGIEEHQEHERHKRAETLREITEWYQGARRDHLRGSSARADSFGLWRTGLWEDTSRNGVPDPGRNSIW